MLYAMPMYQPPSRGALGGRIGGSTRGTDDDVPMVSVLAPDHTGLTATEQPVLYWYISNPIETYSLSVSLLNDMDDDPTLQVNFDGGIEPGLHALNLADHNVRLSPDVEYEWSVSLMVDPENRSKDVFSRGLIMYVDPSSTTQAAAQSEGASSLASQGLWYDALDAVSNLVDSNPGQSMYRNQRASLLEQIDLAEVAAFERSE